MDIIQCHQWWSVKLEIEGSVVRDLQEALRCVLEDDTILCLYICTIVHCKYSTGSTQKDRKMFRHS